MTAPLDARVAELAAEPGRTWGLPDALAAILCVPAVFALSVLLLAAAPELPGPLAILLATGLLGVGAALVARRPARQSGGAERALGLDLPEWSDAGRLVRWSLLLLLAQGLALVAVGAAIPRLRGVTPDNTSFLRDASPLLLVAVAIAAVLLAPVVEELLFRGIVLRGLMLRIGFWPAAVVSSFCFGVLHATGTGLEAVPLIVATGVFGLGLCVLTRRTGRLGPAIGVHALRNALAIAVVAFSS